MHSTWQPTGNAISPAILCIAMQVRLLVCQRESVWVHGEVAVCFSLTLTPASTIWDEFEVEPSRPNTHLEWNTSTVVYGRVNKPIYNYSMCQAYLEITQHLSAYQRLCCNHRLKNQLLQWNAVSSGFFFTFYAQGQHRQLFTKVFYWNCTILFFPLQAYWMPYHMLSWQCQKSKDEKSTLYIIFVLIFWREIHMLSVSCPVLP